MQIINPSHSTANAGTAPCPLRKGKRKEEADIPKKMVIEGEE